MEAAAVAVDGRACLPVTPAEKEVCERRAVRVSSLEAGVASVAGVGVPCWLGGGCIERGVE